MFLSSDHPLLRRYYAQLNEKQFSIAEELRATLCELLPHAREKISYGVPFYSINQRVAFIWPTDIPKSGVPEDGVLLGFWNGYLLRNNAQKFRGKMNKVVRFVVYESLDQLDHNEIAAWIDEAVEIDASLA